MVFGALFSTLKRTKQLLLSAKGCHARPANAEEKLKKGQFEGQIG
jgi:hypothetical protein